MKSTSRGADSRWTGALRYSLHLLYGIVILLIPVFIICSILLADLLYAYWNATQRASSATSFFYELLCSLITLLITIAQIAAHYYSRAEPITFLISSILLFSGWAIQVGLGGFCDMGGECAIYWSERLPERDGALFYLKLVLGLMVMGLYIALMVFSSIAIHRMRMQKLMRVSSTHKLVSVAS